MEDEFFMVNLNEAGPLCSKGEEHSFACVFHNPVLLLQIRLWRLYSFVCNFCPVHIFKAEIDTGIKCILSSPFSKF